MQTTAFIMACSNLLCHLQPHPPSPLPPPPSFPPPLPTPLPSLSHLLSSLPLFTTLHSDNYTLQVNPDSGFCNEHHIEYFRFIGRILAMAIYHQRLIDGTYTG